MDEKAKEMLEALRTKREQSLELSIKASSAVKMSADECKSLCSKIGLKYREGYEDRVVQFRFTDATADRHNEVIIPEGVDLKAYKKDPNVLLMHNAFTFPIGKSIETKYDPSHKDVVGKVLFFDDEVDRTGMSETTFRMVNAGAVQTGSIGFRAKPEHIRLASPEERKKYKLDKFGIIFDQIELREFSIVTIPANPNATQIAARKGMYTEEALKTLKDKGAPDEEIRLLSFDSEEDDEFYSDVEGEIKYADIDEDGSFFLDEEKQDSMVIQTLIFDKKKFPKKEDVHKWIKEHDRFKLTKPLDETENSWRARQRPPGDFKEGTFRTIKITDGVKAVAGKLKAGKKAGDAETSTNEVMDVTIHILQNDTTEVKNNKMELAKSLNTEGHAVKLIICGEGNAQGDIIDYIEKAGAVLSKKNKAVIQNALDSITKLKSDLENLLNLSNDTDGKDDGESDSVHNDSERDTTDGDSDMYTLLDSLTEKVKVK